MAEQIGLQAILDLTQWTKATRQYEKDVSAMDKSTKGLASDMPKLGTSFDTASEGAGGMSTGLNTLRGALSALGLAVTGRELLQFGQESIQAAAEVERLGIATDALASRYGSSAEGMVAAIQQASGYTISRFDAMGAANKAMLFEIVNSEQQMSELTQIAVTLGAAMGQTAAKSMDDLSTALGRQSPLILDNLGISLKLSEAHEMYAASIGKSVSALTDEEKQQAFVTAALEAGRQKMEELGGVQVTMASQTEAASAAFADFKVAFGDLLTTLTGGIGVMQSVTNALRQMTDGAGVWARVIESDIPTINAQLQAHIKLYNPLNKEIFTTAKSYEDYTAQVKAATDAGKNLSAEMMLTRQQYDALGGATVELTDEQRTLTETQLQYQEALRSDTTVTTESVARDYDALAAHQMEFWTAVEDDARESLEEQKKIFNDMATAYAESLVDIADARTDFADDEQAFRDRIAGISDSANEEKKTSEESLTEDLAGIEEERQEKIHWVLTGAHARTQEENDAALEYWNNHYDELVTQAEGKYTERNTKIEEKEQERLSAAAAVRAAEKAEQEQHLQDLILLTVLKQAEMNGTLAGMTGGLATTANDALELIRSGYLTVTPEMQAMFANATTGINTDLDTMGVRAEENATAISEALSGEFTENVTPAAEGVAMSLDEMATAAGTTVPEALTLMGTTGTEAMTPLSTQMTTMDTTLRSMNDETLPTLTETTTTYGDTAATAQGKVTTAVDATTTALGTLNTAILTAKTTAKTASTDMVKGFDDIKEAVDNLNSRVKDLIDKLKEASTVAAGMAAGIMSQVAKGGGGGGTRKSSGGFRMQHGGAFTVPSGYPNDSFPIGPAFRPVAYAQSREVITVTPRGEATMGAAPNMNVMVTAYIGDQPIQAIVTDTWVEEARG